MIPARDGVKLHTVLFTPHNASGPLPIVFERTPYGATDSEKTLAARYPYLAADGYIFAFQDIRGRFKSEGQFVMQRPPAQPRRPQGHRRRHRRLRHHRVADPQRPRQQRTRRHPGHFLRRLAHHHGAARAAPRAQGRLRAGFARRHVPGRRFPSQRRLPPQLWLRVRRHDGDRQGGQHPLRIRPRRHLPVVSRSRRALQRQRKIPPRHAAHLERFRQPPELRRVLAEAGLPALYPRAQSAQPERRRLVGPGGFLRSAENLRTLREGRPAAPELPGGRSVEPRRLGPHRRHANWATSRSTATPASISSRRSRRRGSPIG